jgi:Zn-dependent peptidase ImmA (M78 family)
MAVRRKYIRELVERILDEHEIQPGYVDAELIAQYFGANVVRHPAADELSGFLMRNYESQVSIIGVNPTHSLTRQHFTIAHELGHLLLHEGDKMHIDRSGYGWRFRRQEEQPDARPSDEEQEANLFAAELLMPKRFLDAEMSAILSSDFLSDTLDSVLEPLAKRYGVSTQALTFRLSYLGYIEL